MGTKRLSVIIVTYNSEADIYDCLDTVFGQNDLPSEELEVIVVDNASAKVEELSEQLRLRYDDSVRFLRNHRNGGYGQGNNVGIRAATAPVLLIMNPDVRLMEPCFRKATDSFDGDGQLAMYGMKQMLTPSRPSRDSVAFTMRMNGYLRPVVSALTSRMDLYLQRYMYLQGSCFFVRKSMMEQAGCFDEENFMYGEEDDLHSRICSLGQVRICYNPKLHYQHLSLGRKPSLDYELKKIQAAVRLAAKQGYPREQMLKNAWRSTRLLRWKEYFKVVAGANPERYDMYGRLKQAIETLLQCEETDAGAFER